MFATIFNQYDYELAMMKGELHRSEIIDGEINTWDFMPVSNVVRLTIGKVKHYFYPDGRVVTRFPWR